MKIDYQATFQKLLDHHIKAGYLRDKRIQRILGDIPLERLFTREQLERFVCQDAPVLFYYRDEENVRTVSAPHMISMMTSMMELDPNDKVLILGSKGGLIEATIAKIVKDVYIIEQHEEVASITEDAFVKLGLKNIWVRQANPLLGLDQEGPFNKILITGAIPFVPFGLLEQLAPNGILVAPLMIGNPNQQLIFQFIKRPQLEIINFGGVIFQPLYCLEMPPVNPKKDITIEKIVLHAKNNLRPDILEQKEFFEDFRYLPSLEFHQMLFSSNNQITLEIDRDVNRADNELGVEFLLYYFNPDENKVSFDFEASLNSNPELYHQSEVANSGQQEIHFPMKIPIKEGEYTLNFAAVGPKNYRIAHGIAMLYISEKNKKLSLSLEFSSMRDEDEESEEIED